MKTVRKLFSVIIIFIFVSTMATANVDSKEVSAFLKTVNIKTQNFNQSTEVLFYEDHIYLPLRSIAETLNSSIKWEGLTQTAEITSPEHYIDFPESNPLKGETFVYGEIVDIDKINYTITIEQHIDDNSIYLEPKISVCKDVILILQRNDKKMNIDFDDLHFGEYVGIVLNQEKQARGIILNG